MPQQSGVGNVGIESPDDVLGFSSGLKNAAHDEAVSVGAHLPYGAVGMRRQRVEHPTVTHRHVIFLTGLCAGIDERIGAEASLLQRVYAQCAQAGAVGVKRHL